MSEREILMKKIASVDFAVKDLNLYMDSHPNDMSVSKLLQKYQEKSKVLRKQYEEMYGPVTSNNMDENRWGWISNPWPWDKSEGGN